MNNYDESLYHGDDQFYHHILNSVNPRVTMCEFYLSTRLIALLTYLYPLTVFSAAG